MLRNAFTDLLVLLLLCLTSCSDSAVNDSVTNQETTATVSTTLSEETTIGETTQQTEEQTSSTVEKQSISEVVISFDYQRGTTIASNQVAVWIENTEGELVKTLYVSDFTAARRGYESRDMTLSEWVKTAVPSDMSDDDIDAVSSATLGTGSHSFSWDLTDENGERVPDGVYTVKGEGTLYWESSILFSSQVDICSPISGDLTVTEIRSEPDTQENADMIDNVRIYVVS